MISLTNAGTIGRTVPLVRPDRLEFKEDNAAVARAVACRRAIPYCEKSDKMTGLRTEAGRLLCSYGASRTLTAKTTNAIANGGSHASAKIPGRRT